MEKIKKLAKGTEYFSIKGQKISDDFLIRTPYMDKYDVQRFQDEMLVGRYQNTYRNQLLKIRTSGSTGKIVEILWNPDDYIASNLSLWRERWRYYRIKNTDFYLTFHSLIYSGTQVRENRELEIILNKTYLSINKLLFSESKLDDYIKLFARYPIKWIFTQPSMLLIFIKALQKNNLDPKRIFPHLRYIELNGEILFQSEQELFYDFFKVPIANLYGASEVNGIAYQCPGGHLHILEKNVKVQLFNYRRINEHIYEGEIAVSSLHNKVMPIISYALGDKVTIDTNVTCKYSISPVVNILIGRSNDRIPLLGNISFSSYQLSYWVERVNTEIGNPILEYKANYKNQKITIFLYIKQDFRGWENEIVYRFKKHLEKSNIKEKIDCICLLNPIELSDNGKVRGVEFDEETKH